MSGAERFCSDRTPLVDATPRTGTRAQQMRRAVSPGKNDTDQQSVGGRYTATGFTPDRQQIERYVAGRLLSAQW